VTYGQVAAFALQTSGDSVVAEFAMGLQRKSRMRMELEASEFRRHHAVAHAKLERALTLLWASDSVQQLTTIGHLCREAMQEFATSLAAQHHVDVSPHRACKDRRPLTNGPQVSQESPR
jgi:hypothetical protein